VEPVHMLQTSVVVPSALVLPPLPEPPHAAIPSARPAAAAPATARCQIVLVLMVLLDAESGHRDRMSRYWRARDRLVKGE
jgi:hypothetical protein